MLLVNVPHYHILIIMNEKSVDLRKVLSLNIKKQRGLLGISQEKLAEKADISANMIKDIEGCRTWVSDKTLLKLAAALKTDIYRLFVPATVYEDEIYKTTLHDLVSILKRIKKDIDLDFDNALKLWDLPRK